MPAITAYFSAFIDGQLAPFWTHALLLFGIFVAELLVGIGVLLESPKEKALREWLGLVFVFGGIIISMFLTIALFVFDEGISHAQQSRIVRLDSQIAQRTLDKEQIAALESVRGKVKAVNVMPEAELEASAFAGFIIGALQKAGVRVSFFSDTSGMEATGIILLYPTSLESIGDVNKEPLYKAFNEAKLTPMVGSLQNWFPGMNIPRDVPFIFVGEKYLFVDKFPASP